MSVSLPASRRTLYLCYFGIRQPLVQTQVLPYLRYLSKAGIQVHLLTFEPNFSEWDTAEREAQRSQLASQGIHWWYLPYHKTPSLLATVFDICAGARLAVRLVREHNINVLHARAHVPMAMALIVRRLAQVKLIFDVRGLMAEEYADAGIWKESSMVYRAVKWLEGVGIRRADQIVVLTERFRDWLVSNKFKAADQVQVIPCCVDFARFNGENFGHEVASDKFEVVYAGSLVGLYLLDEMGTFFRVLKTKQDDAFLRILSASPPEEAAAALRRTGLQEKDFEIINVSPDAVAHYISRAQLGVSFRKSSFAQIAASPTKIPEYLAGGLPVICNSGVGDMDGIVASERVGAVLQNFDETSYENAAIHALALTADASVRERAKKVAHTYFDLAEVGGPRYLEVYRRL